MSFLMSIVANELQQSAEKLRDELSILNLGHQVRNTGMYITHDGESKIIVHGTISNKAYVPKKYDGWEVRFVEWDEKQSLDIDEQLDLYI